ncbi:MAG: polyphosphate polymerase domain-containing protein [Crocinitomicaceae bacterium]|nr:polyphosphate polymerase domain-containing protein [Crocinitomicaceae bacterium]
MSISRIQEIAEDFTTIDLTEMDKVQLMSRVDTKFTFSQKKLIEILPNLQKDYRVLSVDGILLSEYESLYYDDAQLTSYVDHHRKRLSRFKVRYRKYINSNIAFLEVKHKKNGRTNKKRIPVDDIPLELSEEHEKFVKKTGVKGGKLQPCLWNSFKRITLVSKAMNERLTFDIDLTFKWDGKEQKEENIIIAELKQGKAMRNSPFYQLMKNHQIRPLRVSKYCIGIIMMYGKKKVKYNRFKKKLLKLNKINKHAA